MPLVASGSLWSRGQDTASFFSHRGATCRSGPALGCKRKKAVASQPETAIVPPRSDPNCLRNGTATGTRSSERLGMGKLEQAARPREIPSLPAFPSGQSGETRRSKKIESRTFRALVGPRRQDIVSGIAISWSFRLPLRNWAMSLEIDFIEELQLRRWARENYVPPPQRPGTWHPIVQDEMRKKDHEQPRMRTVSARNSTSMV